MIAQLNGKIDDLRPEIENLKAENRAADRCSTNRWPVNRYTGLAKESCWIKSCHNAGRKAHVEDVGSTFRCLHINITPIDIKGSGKEKQPQRQNVDVFRISFDIDENRICDGVAVKNYMCVVYGPDGKPITMPTSGSGTFTTLGMKAIKSLPIKMDVNYEQGKRLPVSFDWKPEAGKYQTGKL